VGHIIRPILLESVDYISHIGLKPLDDIGVKSMDHMRPILLLQPMLILLHILLQHAVRFLPPVRHGAVPVPGGWISGDGAAARRWWGCTQSRGIGSDHLILNPGRRQNVVNFN
jgi:hypothetical protein